MQVKDNLKDGKSAIIKSLNLVDVDGNKLSSDLIQEEVLIDGDSKMFDLGQVNTSSDLYLRAPDISTDELLSNDGNFNINVSVPIDNSATKLKLFENNVLLETRNLVSNSELQNISFNIDNREEGSYTYFAVLEDDNGESLESKKIDILVDNIIPPTIKVSSEEVKNDQLGIEITIPPLNNAKTLNLYMDGQKIATTPLTFRNPYEANESFELYSIIEGVHTFWAEVEDENIAVPSKKVTVTVY